MKKFIICVSILTVVLSMFAACSDKSDSEETTATTPVSTNVTQNKIDDNYSMTQAQYTVGGVKTSEKFGDGGEYYINYYDENGFVSKVAIYENGRMAYYYTVDAADEMGNCLRSKYYTPGGKFVAYFENNFFFDSAGNKMTETEFEKRLGIE